MTVKIQGKEYMEVAERLSIFREKHPNGQITTEIIEMSNGYVTMKASVMIDGVVIATGHAQEKEGSTFINKTSYIENCETSAVGRALGIFGIGLLDSVASANEVINARANQNPDKKEALFPEQTSKITWMQGDLYKRLIESLDTEEIKETMKHWNTSTHKMSNAYKETLLDKLKGMGAV